MKQLTYRGKRQQGGFTLLELAIVVAIIAIIIAALSQIDDTDKAKAAVALQSMDAVASSSTRLRMDAGCFPLRPDAAFVQASAATSSCGTDLRPRWRGPYMTDAATNGTGALLLPQVSAQATLTLISAPGGRGTQYFVRASNMPNSLINTMMETCGPKCIPNTPAGGTGTIDLKYAETL